MRKEDTRYRIIGSHQGKNTGRLRGYLRSLSFTVKNFPYVDLWRVGERSNGRVKKKEEKASLELNAVGRHTRVCITFLLLKMPSSKCI